MFEQNVIVVGASAGGVEALIRLCNRFPANLPAAVLIVLHTAPNAPGLLPRILSRHSLLPAVFPKSGDPLETGKIYIAPPDLHLLVQPDSVELTSGPRENLVRPSVDTLFRSAARVFKRKVIGVVLSGTRNDGTVGLLEIHERGGVTIVQDPNEALFPGMPESVLQRLKVDYVLPLIEIAATITRLASESVVSAEENQSMEKKLEQEKIDREMQVVQKDKIHFEESANPEGQTMITCPECGGVLWEIHEGELTRYACHIGHSYSEGSLLLGKTKALEDALWVAVRSLEERVSISKRMANRAKTSGRTRVYEMYHEQAEEAERAADIVRSIVLDGVVKNSQKEQNSLE